jgi:hypothetical protein
MTTDQCRNCRFFDLAHPQTGYGHCHRYPPRMSKDPNLVSTEWWCGEFRGAPTLTENLAAVSRDMMDGGPIKFHPLDPPPLPV